MSILVTSSSRRLAHNVVGHVCGVTKECFLSPLLLSLLHLLHVSATAIPISAASLRIRAVLPSSPMSGVGTIWMSLGRTLFP